MCVVLNVAQYRYEYKPIPKWNSAEVYMSCIYYVVQQKSSRIPTISGIVSCGQCLWLSYVYIFILKMLLVPHAASTAFPVCPVTVLKDKFIPSILVSSQRKFCNICISH